MYTKGGTKEMKRTRSVMLAAILLLSAVVVFAGTAAAGDFPPENPDDDPNKIYGYITDANGNSIGAGHTVEIKKDDGGKWHLIGGTLTTDANGYYDTGYVWMVLKGYGWPSDNYEMYLDGNLVATTTVKNSDWVWDDQWWKFRFSYQWDVQIPEFATMAIPVVALLGLFAFYRRKQKK
jgi:hypothetical protein